MERQREREDREVGRVWPCEGIGGRKGVGGLASASRRERVRYTNAVRRLPVFLAQPQAESDQRRQEPCIEHIKAYHGVPDALEGGYPSAEPGSESVSVSTVVYLNEVKTRFAIRES